MSRPAIDDVLADAPLVEDDQSATVPYRVRFDECGRDGAARASAYLRYAQDVAWIHSERLGFDRAWYDARSVIWVVRAISLDILAASVTADVLNVRTRVVGFRRVWARRVTDMRRSDGSAVALARTDWVMIDLRGMPTRVPDAITSRFHGAPETATEPLEPIRLARAEVPADAVELRLRVRPQEVDPQEHANKATWMPLHGTWLAARRWASRSRSNPCSRTRAAWRSSIPTSSRPRCSIWRSMPATPCPMAAS